MQKRNKCFATIWNSWKKSSEGMKDSRKSVLGFNGLGGVRSPVWLGDLRGLFWWKQFYDSVIFLTQQNRNSPCLGSAEVWFRHAASIFMPSCISTKNIISKQPSQLQAQWEFHIDHSKGCINLKPSTKVRKKSIWCSDHLDSVVKEPDSFLLLSLKTHRAVRTMTFSTDWQFLMTAAQAVKLKVWWISHVTDFKASFIFTGGQSLDQYASVVYSDFKGFQMKLTTDNCKRTSSKHLEYQVT